MIAKIDELERQKCDLTQLQETFIVQKNEIDQLTVKTTTQGKELSRKSTLCDAVLAHQNELNSKLTFMEEELQNSTLLLIKTTESLRNLKDSTFWRITGPIRRSLAKIPSSARKTLRRGAKALWWLITPHKIPKRLVYLRNRSISESVVNLLSSLQRITPLPLSLKVPVVSIPEASIENVSPWFGIL